MQAVLVQADMALAMMLHVMRTERRDINLLVMSATLEDDLIKRLQGHIQRELQLDSSPRCIMSHLAPHPTKIFWRPLSYVCPLTP
jgi:HrpA-like RNA helicase